MEATVYLPAEKLSPLVTAGQGTLIEPIPTANLCIDTLPGEKQSAWRVDRYTKNGRAYQNCLRLAPFGKFPPTYLVLKAKYARRSYRFAVTSCEVEQRGDTWVWVVKIKRSHSLG